MMSPMPGMRSLISSSGLYAFVSMSKRNMPMRRAAYIETVVAVEGKGVDFVADMLVAAKYVCVGFQHLVVSVGEHSYEAARTRGEPQYGVACFEKVVYVNDFWTCEVGDSSFYASVYDMPGPAPASHILPGVNTLSLIANIWFVGKSPFEPGVLP